MMSLSDIRRRVAEGQLGPALDAAREYAEKANATDVLETLAALRADLDDMRNRYDAGQLTFDEHGRRWARAAQGLLDGLDRLSHRPTSHLPRRGVREGTFKIRLFYMLLLGKVLVLGRLYYHWSTGGFNNDQFWACAGILSPMFAGYVYLMLDYYVRTHKQHTPPPVRYVSGPLAWLVWPIILSYVAALIWLMEGKVKPPHLPFSLMTGGFALVEAVLGGYVNRVVSAFFKE